MLPLKRSLTRICALVALGLFTAVAASAADRLADAPQQPGVPQTTIALPDGTSAHIMPTVQLQDKINQTRLKALGRGAPPPTLNNVTYHGGPIMTSVNLYAIFWAPPTLQNGNPTSMPTSYRTVLTNMMRNYAGHSIANINTQYFQQVGLRKTYHSGLGRLAGSVIDTSAYPASGCTDTFTPGNCLSDAQIRAKIDAVRIAQGWPTGGTNMYLLFTTNGEGSCFGSGPGSCAYTAYCAYHSFFTSPSGGGTVIYSNEPFGNNSVCQVTSSLPNPGTSDSAATAARHEISEATSDPQLNAWFDPLDGDETSDKCNFNYGAPLSWDGGLANYFWGGFFFLLQQEYSNHKSNCTQEGP
jgi:hypothetical protein